MHPYRVHGEFEICVYIKQLLWSYKMLITVADWDSMGHVITQTRGRAFSLKRSEARPSVPKARLSISKARPHVLKQMPDLVF